MKMKYENARTHPFCVDEFSTPPKWIWYVYPLVAQTVYYEELGFSIKEWEPAHSENETSEPIACFDTEDEAEAFIEALRKSPRYYPVSYDQPAIPICGDCMATTGGAVGEPDFAWRPSEDGEACAAADHTT